jgi:hypothetical protein
MKFILRDRNGHLKGSGLQPGVYVKIFQGAKTINGTIGEVDYSQIGDESFLCFEDEPECTIGSGVFFVKKDGYLVHIKSDWDTSD